MKKIFIFVAFAIGINAHAFENVPLSDFGGKHLSLYGLTDYKATVEALRIKNVKPVAFDKNVQPAYNADGTVNEATAKYAIVGIVFYNANYAFMSYDPTTNPNGEVHPRTMPQFFISHAIVNPAAIEPDYATDRIKYNPSIPGLFFGMLTTSDQELLSKGREIWLNPWQLGKAGVFEYSYNPKKRNNFHAEASFFETDDSLMAKAKLGKSTKIETALIERQYRANAIATSQVGKTLYPIEANDTMLQRLYDTEVDSYELGGDVKTYLESLSFIPFLWQSSANFKSKIYENYEVK